MNNLIDKYETLILKNLVYLYYPTNISAVANTTEYLKTKEFINLKAAIDSSIGQSEFETMELEIAKKYDQLRLQKVSAKNWLDRAECYWLDEVVGNSLFRYKIQISKLIPYFAVYLTRIELNPENPKIFTGPPKIVNKEEFSKESKNLINDLKEYIKNNFDLKYFDINLNKYIIKNVSFQDIEFGKFSLYNAFFTNTLK